MRCIGLAGQPRHALDRVERQLEAVDIIQHAHVERSRRRALLLVSAHVQVVVVVPPVSEPVNPPRIAVKRKDRGHAGGKMRS